MGEMIEKSEEDKTIISETLPILPLRDAVLFPKMVMPLLIGQPKSLKLVDAALGNDKIIGVITTREPQASEAKPEHLYSIGTAAQLIKMIKMPDGTVRALVKGLSRIKLIEIIQEVPFFKGQVETIPEVVIRDLETDALIMTIKNLFQKAIELATNLPKEIGSMIMSIDEPNSLADFVASNINLSTEKKQEILETLDIKKRLEKISILLNRELEILEVGSKIQSQVKGEMEKSQREYYLREQLKAIQRELGEGEDRGREIQELGEKIAQAKMPPEVEKQAMKELNRLAKIPPAAAEYTVARTYLDWLIEMPWSISTEDNLDIPSAQQILEEDHYDLEKVKKRILEYLAVRKLKKDMKGPILCFVGPPGVGKTSLGKSIARALGRKFVRISLGGIRDEAEIRGHRRTYVGALPGRIIQGIKKAGSNNPVFMLDEIDKVGTDFRGDPTAALLEVLDPEQNFSFSDHYLDVDFDLSKVMFITTANLLDPIPTPLRDRMEVLELPGYTREEKIIIAKKFLIPRQLNEHGLSEEFLLFEDEALNKIISEYTREAGLRNLEREIATICRAVAKEIAQGKKETVIVTPERVPDFLGPMKFFPEIAQRKKEPGIATGLAWTPAGGSIIFVEATKMKGQKNLSLTGQLGDVMKESAQAALTYIRSRANELAIPEDFFEKYDIHIHVPSGAVPKDGPSAGITMLTALASILTERPVRNDVAMTGEITLRGKVLPVGGIKEKVLAAKGAGIKLIILPKRNHKDLEEIPSHIKDGLEFCFVDKVDEVLATALQPIEGPT
jgi:ATP-dependent Lon protease